MTNLAYEFDLAKDTQGTTTTMHLVLPHGTRAHVVFDELDFEKRAFVATGTFVPPITRPHRDRFFEHVLRFNRNAISLLNCGLVPDPQHPTAFTPTWYVPKFAQTEKTWEQQLSMYESLVADCACDLRTLLKEWTASYLH